MDGKTTKQGYKMDRQLRARIVRVMTENAGLTREQVASLIGINKRTLRDYLTPELLEEIGLGREVSEQVTLEDVDKAMMAQARGGNVAAARTAQAAVRGQSNVLALNAQRQASILDYYNWNENSFGNTLSSSLGNTIGSTLGKTVTSKLSSGGTTLLGSLFSRG